MNKILKINNLSKKYNTLDGEIEALKNISLELKENEFIAIVGTSGCGKSTILSIIDGLVEKSDGEITFYNGTPTIGYMFQEDALFNHYNVLNNVTLSLKVRHELNETKLNYVIDLLKKYNLYNFKDKYPKELSGGMKQRCALIRTLAINPDLLLLDEPFSALDYKTRLIVADDVYRIIKENKKATILVTHDIAEAISMADKVIVLSKSPAIIKNIYNIELSKKDIPSKNRNDQKFNYYYEKIWKDLNDDI